MRDFPSDPMRQHSRFMSALCDDFASGHFSLKGGKAERVMEICRQVNGANAANRGTAPLGKPEPQSPLSFGPSGECRLSQGEKK